MKIFKTFNLLAINIIFAVFFLLVSCGKVKTKNERCPAIDITDAYSNKGEALLSSIADSVEYIQLDNSEGHILDYQNYLSVVDNLLIQTDGKKIYVYSRINGKFLYEISSFGRGPNEHLRVEKYDEVRRIIWAVGNARNQKIGFSIDGSRVFHFMSPEPVFKSGQEFFITSGFPLSAAFFAGFVSNSSGKVKDKVVVFDSLGKICKRFPNYNFFDKKESDIGFTDFSQGWFYNFADTVRFFELYTDTVYSVTNKKLIPRYYLNMGKFSPPYYFLSIPPDAKGESEKLKYFEIRGMCESSNYLFFTVDINYYRHFVFYNKETKKTVVCDNENEKEYYKFPANYAIRSIGLINDIDNFIPVATGGKQFCTIKGNELVTYINAIDAVHWFQSNPDKAAKLPERLRRFSNVKATDNIIVEVVHLKK